MPGRILASALACLVAGAFQAVHSLLYRGTVGLASVGFAIVETAIVLGALTLRFDWRRRQITAWSVVASGVLALGVGVAVAFAAAALGLGDLPRLPAGIVAEIGLFDGLLGLGLWGLAVVVPQMVHDARLRAVEIARLRTEAELVQLRAHVQPHFLLNTLNTIAGLVADEPHQARALLTALGDLLRSSLDAGTAPHTLGDEVAWLRRYAEIIETRHRGTIQFRWEIAEPTEAVVLPRLLLQPLVENAVKHGALRRRDGGEVAIRTTMAADHTVTCVIEDNGPGPGAPREGALGLALVTRRLALEVGGAATFRLERVADQTRAIVELPS